MGNDKSRTRDHRGREAERVANEVFQWNDRQQYQGEADQTPRDPERSMAPIAVDGGESRYTNREQDKAPLQGDECGTAEPRDSKHTWDQGAEQAVDNTDRAAGTTSTICPTAHICGRLVHHVIPDLLNVVYAVTSWPYCNKIAITTGLR